MSVEKFEYWKQRKRRQLVRKQTCIITTNKKKNLAWWMLLRGWPCKEKTISKETNMHNIKQKEKPFLLDASPWVTLRKHEAAKTEEARVQWWTPNTKEEPNFLLTLEGHTLHARHDNSMESRGSRRAAKCKRRQYVHTEMTTTNWTGRHVALVNRSKRGLK